MQNYCTIHSTAEHCLFTFRLAESKTLKENAQHINTQRERYKTPLFSPVSDINSILLVSLVLNYSQVVKLEKT